MRTLINRLEAEGAFDREAISILIGAFEDAWHSQVSNGVPFATDRCKERAREIIAKHIIALARLGERDKRKLAESALMELAQSNLKNNR
jgi:hypothetical protein